MQLAESQHLPFLTPESFASVDALLEKAVEDEVFPGCVFLVGRDGEALYNKAFGFKNATYNKNVSQKPMNIETVFDIASLTSVIASTTLLMKLWEVNKVSLQDRVSRYLQSFGVFGKSPITIAQLLSHSSGLAAWAPYFEELVAAHGGARIGILTSKGAREYIYTSICRSQLKYPPGTKQIYSDIGFIMLGALIEVLTGLSLERAFNKFVAQPLGLRNTSYIDLSKIKRRGIHPVTDLIAPTEYCPWRKRVLWGEVHDDNAWAMGGIAGHSGIFSTLWDVHLFAREMLLAYRGQSSFLKRETVRKFWAPQSEFVEGGWRYGWDSPNKENGMKESGLTPNAVGATGFTGCSLWIEPEENQHFILLSNRIHPSRNNKKLSNFRPEIHAAAQEVLRGC